MCFYQFWKQCVSIWKMCWKCIVFCQLWSMNDKSVCGFWEMWSLHAFCLKAMKNNSQFGPHRLLCRWMCEQFWKYGFSIEQYLLAIEKNCNYCFRIYYYYYFIYIFLSFLYLFLCFFYFSQVHFVNVDGFSLWYIKIGCKCCFSHSFFVL